MTDAGQSTSVAAPGRWLRFKIALGIEPDPTGRPTFIWLERWNARIIWFFIVFGVPLLGASGIDLLTKWVIAAVWFALWSPFFSYFEFRELAGQMLGRGSIRSDQLSEQQDTAQQPRYAVRYAIFIWLAALLVQMTLRWQQYDGSVQQAITVDLPTDLWAWLWHGTWRPWINYQIEWFVLVHAWYVTKRFNALTYDIGNILSKATPMAERTERRLPRDY